MLPSILFLLAAIGLFWLIIQGAPFVPTDRRSVERMVKMLAIRPGELAVDLGAGEGRIVIALAQAGAVAHGYEINPLLVWIARKNIRKASLQGKAFVHWKSFWRVSLRDYSVVAVFGINSIMKRLEKKLTRELVSGARVASNIFKFPNWKYLEEKDGIYVYRIT